SKVSAGTVCRVSAGSCDVAETCDGSSNGCATDAVVAASTVCRASDGVCGVAETCPGQAANSPADSRQRCASTCRNAAPGKTCDAPAMCDGGSHGCHG